MRLELKLILIAVFITSCKSKQTDIRFLIDKSSIDNFQIQNNGSFLKYYHTSKVEIQNNSDEDIYMQTYDSCLIYANYTKKSTEGLAVKNISDPRFQSKIVCLKKNQSQQFYFWYLKDKQLYDSLIINFQYYSDPNGKKYHTLSILYELINDLPSGDPIVVELEE